MRRGDRQLQGRREPLADERRHRLAAVQRQAEIAVQRAAEPIDVLHEDRTVEAEPRVDGGDLSGVAFSPTSTATGPPGTA